MYAQRISTLLILVFGVIGLDRTADADLALAFSSDGGLTFSDSFSTILGNSTQIGIHLQETAPDTILSNEGLIGFGLDLNFSPTSGGAISNAAPNSFFDFQNHNVNTGNGFEWEFFESANTGLNGSTIVIGSFQFDSTDYGSTVFTIEDRLIGSGIGNASWLTSGLTDLDEDIFGAGAAGNYQFSVTAVPEPGCLGFLSAVIVVFTGHRRKRI